MKQITSLISVGIGGLLVLCANPARAQGFGLQVIDSAEARNQTFFDFTAGAVIGHDQQFYGVRDTIAIDEGTRLFVDLGIVRPEMGSSDLAAQLGMVVNLPLDLPVDIGLRAAGYGCNGDLSDVFGCNLMALASKEAIFEGLFFYGGLGLDYRRVKTMTAADEEGVWDTQVNPLLALGALMPITKNIFFYTEVTVSDDSFIGLGLRYR